MKLQPVVHTATVYYEGGNLYPRKDPMKTGRLRLLNLLLIAALALSLVAFVQPAQAVSPDIVISQVYGGGGNSGATLKNDFIELYNRGATAVNVTGWTVQYASSTGSSWRSRCTTF